MKELTVRDPIGIAGAGTMGAGIALLAARTGHRVHIYDTNHETIQGATSKITQFLDANVVKGKMTIAENKDISRRIRQAYDANDLRDCEVVIEAIVEKPEAKITFFQTLEKHVGRDVIIATNTSSLPISSLAAALKHPHRFLGTHFFNPAPVMRLVEVIPGIQTDRGCIETICNLMKLWQKVPVVAKDTPGFIVNRIARPFYGEALRILEEGFAEPVTIDWAMKEVGGFPMGPFELMDLIGNDVNFTVTKTIFEAFFCDPRYRPSIAQQRMVEAKLLGKKTGHGFYRYGEGAKNPEPTRDEERGRAILMRILALIINEAVEAVFLGVATPEAIDLAMKNGVNYPHGPLEWADMLGIPTTLKLIEELHHEYGDDRYRPSPLLKKMVREERTFYGKSDK